MKTLFEAEARENILRRLNALRPEAERQWGKMDPAQMMAHCSATIAMAAGKSNLPRIFVGRILGPLFRSWYTGEKEFGRNGPTAPQLVVSEPRHFNTERERLIQAIREFGEGGSAKCTRHPHPFFGNMKPEEWGIVTYKHLDHHFRQFGA